MSYYADNPWEAPEGDERDCPTCAGEGAVKCPDCAGSGIDDSEGPDDTRPCDECQPAGSGTVKCPDCGGDGVVMVYEPERWPDAPFDEYYDR